MGQADPSILRDQSGKSVPPKRCPKCCQPVKLLPWASASSGPSSRSIKRAPAGTTPPVSVSAPLRQLANRRQRGFRFRIHWTPGVPLDAGTRRLVP